MYTSYQDLEDAVVSELDVEVGQAGLTTSKIAEACSRAEAVVRRKLRTIEGQATATGDTETVDGRTTLATPLGFCGVVDLRLWGGTAFASLAELGASARVVGTTIHITPALVQDVAYRLDYWGELVSIAGIPGASNWLLLGHPDVYLYGVLTELAFFMADPERRMESKMIFDERVRDLADANLMREWYALPQTGVGGGTP